MSSNAQNLDLIETSDHSMPLILGPTEIPGFGRVLEVNILGGSKVCALDCAFCDRGPSTVRLNRVKKDIVFPNAAEIGESLTSALRDLGLRGLLTKSEPLRAIRVYGNGDPALHPDFPNVAEAMLAARAPWGVSSPIEIVTGGALIDQRKTIEAMNKFDERILKVDAGSEKLFKSLNAPLSRTSLAKIIAGARGFKDHIVTSTFVQGVVDNTTAAELEEWIEVVGMLRPKSVRINTAGPRATVPGIKPCDEDMLYTIASKLERKTQLKTLVIY